MTDSSFRAKPGFDDYAADYDVALERGISLSGENKEYFAGARVAWLAERLKELEYRPEAVLDYGCGIGSHTPFLLNLDGAESVLGVDVSGQSLEIARQLNETDRAKFLELSRHRPDDQHDLVFTNGVLHHVPRGDRPGVIDYVYRSLRRGGLFALWENNPWNPGTRLAMRRIPFDRDAIPLSAPEARRLVRAGGFEVLRTDYLFIFPRAFRRLRWLEPHLAGLPFGAQYEVLCRKPANRA
ncbi:MAG TPA: methyltransferase domain-containing protein [Blastocatellia bacterium]|nr:methyltransferase domain-containing protein [Blastocatellia bacterium]